MNIAAKSTTALDSTEAAASTSLSPQSVPAVGHQLLDCRTASSSPALSPRAASAAGDSGGGGTKQDTSEPKPRVSHRASPSTSSKSAPTDDSPPDIPPRIVYGPGTVARLPTELGRLRVTSPLIVSSPSRIALARRIQKLIPNLNSRILDSAVVNVPARVVDDALSRIDGRDVVISVGGASAVGLAKAIGCRKGIPHVCIPTTYSGSEMMPLLLDACPARHNTMGSGSSSRLNSQQRRDREREHGLSGRSRKGARTTSFRDPKVLPSVVIYDEDLTTSMSERISAPSDDDVVMGLSAETDTNDETAQWSYIHLPGV